MLKKLTRSVTNNFGLKIIALLFAIALWLVVVNIDDPVNSTNFSTTISIENSNYMTDQGKYFEVLDADMTVSFRVSVKRSYLKNLSNTDFKAVADMKNIEEVDGKYRVPIDITATRYASSVNFTGATQYREVSVENLVKKQFSITGASTGTPADNYALGTLKVSPNVLKVTGPESIVAQIDAVQATIDVSGAAGDLTDSVTPILFDEDGNQIDASKLTFNIDKVTIEADILDVRNLMVDVSTTGTVADGYVCTDVTVNPSKIAVKGSASALNAATNIEIPASVIDINGATENIVKTVDITEYLPEGVELVNSDDHNVEVTAIVEQIVTEDYAIPVGNITIENVKDGETAAIEGTSVTVTLRGLRSDLDALLADNIKGTIDVTGLGEGTHSVTLKLNVDGSVYKTDGPLTVTVVITKSASGGTGTTGGGTGDGNTTGGTGGNSNTDNNSGSSTGTEE